MKIIKNSNFTSIRDEYSWWASLLLGPIAGLYLRWSAPDGLSLKSSTTWCNSGINVFPLHTNAFNEKVGESPPSRNMDEFSRSSASVVLPSDVEWMNDDDTAAHSGSDAGTGTRQLKWLMKQTTLRCANNETNNYKFMLKLIWLCLWSLSLVVIVVGVFVQLVPVRVHSTVRSRL